MKEHPESPPDIPLGLMEFQVIHAVVKSHLWSLRHGLLSAEDTQQIQVLEPLQEQLSALTSPDCAEKSRYLFWTLQELQAVREALNAFLEFLTKHAVSSPERNEVIAVLEALHQRLGRSIVSRLN